ncbi:hypothetical protein MW887_004919 [Aspergillus wentii]|nr:hypothetical protein MW887_004919 [Aspergillus wentii]
MQKSRIIRNFDGQNSLKIPHEDQVTKSTRSPSYLPGHGDISSTDALPSNSRHELDLDSFSEDITKQIENAFHFGDEEQVTLALPYTPKGHAQEQAADKQDNDVDRGYQKDSSFVAKFRSFTGGSAKTVSGADRRSYQTQSSTTSTGGSRSFRSDSVATQDTNLTGTSSPSVLRTEAAVDTYARTVAVLVHYMNVVIFNARTVKLIHGLHAIGMIIEAVVP